MFNLLIVDDEDIEREGLQMLIERYQYHFSVKTAANGVIALKLLENSPFDVMISDIKMPFMDGLTLCEKAREIHPGIKTVIVSAYGEFEFTHKAIRLKIDDYLMKPIIPEQFQKVVQQIFDGLTMQGQREKKREQLLEDYASANFFKKQMIMDQLIKLEQDQAKDELLQNDFYSSLPVQKATRLIEENYAKDIGLDWVADKVFLSPGYLSAIFKKETGKSVIQYLTICRLEKAKDLLINTNMKVVDIGEKVGYSNHSYFCLIFKKYFGVTAAQIRNDMNGEKWS